VGTLIDSSVLVAVERGRLDLSGLPASIRDDDVAIAAVTASELLHGIYRAHSEARRSRRESFVEAVLRQLPVLPFDVVTARTHARLWAGLVRRGVSVGAHDLMIAATALSAGMKLATRDERSFHRIPGLALLRW
jgi:tRNA(fMet)-specific endonuclease VapC